MKMKWNVTILKFLKLKCSTLLHITDNDEKRMHEEVMF